MKPLSPYSLAHTLNKNDKRIEKYIKQNKKSGFDDSEIWNLDASIAKFILPRLKRFKKVTNGHPADLKNMNEWYNILDKIIATFEIVVTGNIYYNIDPTGTKTEKKIKEGLDLFRKYFMNLWW